MEIMQFLIIGYFILIGIFTVSFYLLIMYPNKFIILRCLLSYMYFIKSIRSNDIVYQSNIEGCGLATIQMLFKRRKIKSSLTDCINLNYNSSLDMYSMSEIIESSGLKTTGYEFRNKRQFENFIQLNPKSSVILLMKRYDSLNQLSFMMILFFPIIFVIELLLKLNLINFPDLHWVLLDEVSDKGVIISDPFFGKIFLTSKRFISCWSKYGLIINK